MPTFNEPLNYAVISCRCIFEENSPILRISRDEDGDWQFLCGGAHAQSDAMVVSLGQVLERDPSVSGAADLAAGQAVVRQSAQHDWQTI